MSQPLPPEQTHVLILGAGPAGIEAALASREAGHDTVVLETGVVCDSVRRWGHVPLFTPWKYNRSVRGAAALRMLGVREPEPEHCPTGAELVEAYYERLAAGPLRSVIHTRTRALQATRGSTIKGDAIGSPARGAHPFRVLWRQPTGLGHREGTIESKYLIDATGTYATPAGLASGGIAAAGEENSRAVLARHLPDLLGRQRHEYIGKHTLLVGDGYSAATALRELCVLLREAPGTRVTWAVRSLRARVACEIEGDPLPERRDLSRAVHDLVARPPAGLQVMLSTEFESFANGDGTRIVDPAKGAAGGEASANPDDHGSVRVVLRGNGQRTELRVDRVLGLTGYRPDLTLLRELQVHLCYATDGLMNLSASLLSAGAAPTDCLKVAGAKSKEDAIKTLLSPEPGLFVIGSKSYGRYSQYLLRTGCEQVDMICGQIRPSAEAREQVA